MRYICTPNHARYNLYPRYIYQYVFTASDVHIELLKCQLTPNQLAIQVQISNAED